MASREKLNILHRHLHQANGHKKCQCADFSMCSVNVQSFPPIKSRRSFNTWPSELSDKLKTLNLQYSNANGHQTWQKGGLPWGSPTTKITCPLNYVILKDHVTIRKVISSLSQRLTPRNLAAWWLKLRWFLPYSYMAKFWCKLALPFP